MFGPLLPILALAAAQAPAPAEPPEEAIGPGAFTLRLDDAAHPSVSMSVGGASQTLLMVYCYTRDGNGVITVMFPERLGGRMRTEIRYSFDNGEEHRGDWMGGGSFLAMGARRMGGFDDFFRRLRGTRSVRLTASRAGRGRQEVAFTYRDPGPMLDEMNRRCGLNL
jgi:hypothetical protein